MMMILLRWQALLGYVACKSSKVAHVLSAKRAAAVFSSSHKKSPPNYKIQIVQVEVAGFCSSPPSIAFVSDSVPPQSRPVSRLTLWDTHPPSDDTRYHQGTEYDIKSDTGPGVYVLELEGGRFYVGKAERSVARRIEQHAARDGGGAAFTLAYKVSVFSRSAVSPATRAGSSLPPRLTSADSRYPYSSDGATHRGWCLFRGVSLLLTPGSVVGTVLAARLTCTCSPPVPWLVSWQIAIKKIYADGMPRPNVLPPQPCSWRCVTNHDGGKRAVCISP